MNEVTLKGFFTDEVSIEKLSEEASSIVTRTSQDVLEHNVDPMSEEFVVSRNYLAKLLDSTILGHLSCDNLSALCTVLELSEQFSWGVTDEDREILAEVAFWCASPEVNHPLTVDNLSSYKEYLITGENPLDK